MPSLTVYGRYNVLNESRRLCAEAAQGRVVTYRVREDKLVRCLRA